MQQGRLALQMLRENQPIKIRRTFPVPTMKVLHL